MAYEIHNESPVVISWNSLIVIYNFGAQVQAHYKLFWQFLLIFVTKFVIPTPYKFCSDENLEIILFYMNNFLHIFVIHLDVELRDKCLDEDNKNIHETSICIIFLPDYSS